MILDQSLFSMLIYTILYAVTMKSRCILDALTSQGYMWCWDCSTWRQEMDEWIKVLLKYLSCYVKCSLKVTNCQTITTRQRRYCVWWIWSTWKYTMKAYYTKMSIKNWRIVPHVGNHVLKVKNGDFNSDENTKRPPAKLLVSSNNPKIQNIIH